MMRDDLIRKVVAYHEKTKHDFGRYAAGPGYMDWATQPDPFRTFSGAAYTYLPPVIKDETPAYHKVFTGDSIPPRPLNAETLSQFLELSLAVSAWKQSGDSRWALRSNPSSGNLHPTEGYLVLEPLEGIHSLPAVFHYAPKKHGLERRLEFSQPQWEALRKGFPEGTFFAGLSSLHWREAWKYGERAFRYCQHDIGHALAAYRIAAGVLGWSAILLEDVEDACLSRLFGLDRAADFENAENEHPDLVLAVFPGPRHATMPLGFDGPWVDEIAKQGNWAGKANRLSPENRPWEIIDAVAQDSIKVGSSGPRRITLSPGKLKFPEEPQLTPREARVSARQIIRQRRSAVSLDGKTSITREQFYRILSHTFHDPATPGLPWDALTEPPRIHLLLFVHRVEGMRPGLYILIRNPRTIDSLKQAAAKEFLWATAEGCPDWLNLFLLKEGDFNSIAARVSCNQNIAGEGAFSLGMIAEFLPALKEKGAWYYRRLFWESGMVGQTLYLAAEHVGIRATGIGCFFDDPVHQVLGLRDNAFQSLYHFTMGGAVEDSRLTTHPAYPWSCELSSGRFVARRGFSSIEKTLEKVRELPENSVAHLMGRSLARIGSNLARFHGNQNDPREALSQILESRINVAAVSPDETWGEDEILLGDALNAGAQTGTRGWEDLFIIVRCGLVEGPTQRTFWEMKERGIWKFEPDSPPGGPDICLHPEFLRDQLNRSLHRLGLGALDLLLLRVPCSLVSHLGRDECLQRIRTAARFLQDECDAGRLLCFGISSRSFALSPQEKAHLSLERTYRALEGMEGFRAVEMDGNVVDREPFENQETGKSPAQRARELGLSVIIESPLRARFEGKELLLIDAPGWTSQSEQAEWERIQESMDQASDAIHSTTLSDGRTVRQVLDYARLPSPYHLSPMIESVLKRFDSESLEDHSRRQEVFQAVLERSRIVGGQFVAGRLWKPEDSQRAMDFLRAALKSVQDHLRIRARMKRSQDVASIRNRFFPNAASGDSLQGLVIDWLLDHGADIVLTGMRHPEYVKEAAQKLRKRT